MVFSQATPEDFTLFSTGSLKVNDRTIVRGPVRSNSYVEYGITSNQYGDIFCSGNVYVKDRAKVYGTITMKGTATVSSSAFLQTPVAQENVPLLSIPTRSFPTGFRNVTVNSGVTCPLAPGNYNEVKVCSNGKLTLGDGTYNMRVLKFEPEAKMDVTVNAGVFLNVSTNFYFADRSSVQLLGTSNPKKVEVYTNQYTQVRIGTDTKVNMTVIAPNAEIYVASRTDIKGRLAAKTITTEPDVFIETITDTRYVDSDHDNIPDAIETELGFNPQNASSTPTLTTPTTWGVSPTMATQDQFVSYRTPEGFSFDVVFPKGSVTSTNYPYLEHLDSLPSGITFTPPAGETVKAMYRMHGQLATGVQTPFSFPFDVNGKNVGSNSISAYKYGGTWQNVDVQVASEAVAITNVGDIFLSLRIITYKENVLLVNAASTSTSPDGKSWENAFPTITQAIAAVPTGTASEIWVAKGTYYAGTSRNESFMLKPDMKLFGGFEGAGTYYFNRDWEKNVTILSGDIGTPGDKTDNTKHIITCNGNNTIDGFRIQDGAASLPGPATGYDNVGGGILITDKTVIHSVNIVNCVFSNNEAYSISPIGPFGDERVGSGAAVCASTSYNVIIDKCVFRNNSTLLGGPATPTYDTHGGAVLFDASSTNICRITNSIFTSNNASLGGAVFGKVEMENCVFHENFTYRTYPAAPSSGKGGAVFGDGIFRNCTFAKNASDTGGALFLNTTTGGYATIFINSILWNNTAPFGGEISNSGWGGGTVTFTYSCVESGINGTKFYGSPTIDGGTNISGNPLFTDINDADGPDNILLTVDDGLMLQRTSPCFNSGVEKTVPSGAPLPTDILGNGAGRYTGEINQVYDSDMGAYWIYLSEFVNFPKIDFLPHKNHPYGFDRITRVSSVYNTPEELAKLMPDEIYISTAFDGQGAGVPNNGLFKLVIDPRETSNGKIQVADATAADCVIRLKDPVSGLLVTELPWGSDKNIYSFEIIAGVKPASVTGNTVHNELQVLNSTGTVLRKLNVEIYVQNDRPLSFYRIHDPASPATEFSTTPTFAEIEAGVNSIYSAAVTKITLSGDLDKEIPFDKNGNGALDYYIGWRQVHPGLPYYPGLTQRETNPEYWEICNEIPNATSMQTRDMIYNWLIIADPVTGQPPQANDQFIWVYDAYTSQDLMFITGDGFLGMSGNASSEPIYVDNRETYANDQRIYKLILKAPLQYPHTISLSGTSISGETLWKRLSKDVKGVATQGTGVLSELAIPGPRVKIFEINYVTFAHEYAHFPFDMPHCNTPEWSFMFSQRVYDNQYRLNLMHTSGGPVLNKRNILSDSDRWYDQWTWLNSHR